MASRLQELKKKWIPKSAEGEKPSVAVNDVAAVKPVSLLVKSGASTPLDDQPAKRMRQASPPALPLRAGIPLGRGRASLRQTPSATTSQPITQRPSSTQVPVMTKTDTPMTTAEVIKEHQEWLRTNFGNDSVVYSSRTSYRFNKKDFREASEFLDVVKLNQPKLFEH